MGKYLLGEQMNRMLQMLMAEPSFQNKMENNRSVECIVEELEN
jgi:hypothetical protein